MGPSPRPRNSAAAYESRASNRSSKHGSPAWAPRSSWVVPSWIASPSPLTTANASSRPSSESIWLSRRRVPLWVSVLASTFPPPALAESGNLVAGPVVWFLVAPCSLVRAACLVPPPHFPTRRPDCPKFDARLWLRFGDLPADLAWATPSRRPSCIRSPPCYWTRRSPKVLTGQTARGTGGENYTLITIGYGTPARRNGCGRILPGRASSRLAIKSCPYLRIARWHQHLW